MEVVVSTINYASFSRRLVAKLLDFLIGAIPYAVLQGVLPVLGPILFFFFYNCLFLSSRAQATPGKWLMAIRVTGADGGKIVFSTAVIRGIFDLISLSCFGLGHLVMLFSTRRQALHDMIAGTFVLRGNTDDSLFDAWTDEFNRLVGRTREEVSRVVDRPSSEREKLELIEKLNQLRISGAITEEEYQKKKTELLK